MCLRHLLEDILTFLLVHRSRVVNNSRATPMHSLVNNNTQVVCQRTVPPRGPEPVDRKALATRKEADQGLLVFSRILVAVSEEHLLSAEAHLPIRDLTTLQRQALQLRISRIRRREDRAFCLVAREGHQLIKVLDRAEMNSLPSLL